MAREILGSEKYSVNLKPGSPEQARKANITKRQNKQVAAVMQAVAAEIVGRHVVPVMERLKKDPVVGSHVHDLGAVAMVPVIDWCDKVMHDPASTYGEKLGVAKVLSSIVVGLSKKFIDATVTAVPLPGGLQVIDPQKVYGREDILRRCLEIADASKSETPQ